MCATVCPSQALFFGTREQIEQLRPRSVARNQFRFGEQVITTRVNVMVPKQRPVDHLDVTAAMAMQALGRELTDDFLLEGMYTGEER